MRQLWCSSAYSNGVYMDVACKKMLTDAGIDKAEEFISVLKASPVYKQMVCDVTKKKLEDKRAEVLALEKTLTGDCM